MKSHNKIMQKIISEICAVSASRKYDMKLIYQQLNAEQKQFSELLLTSEALLSREKVRGDKQKINLMILRKTRLIDATAKQQILYMLYEMIANIDEKVYEKIKSEVYEVINSEQMPEFGELGINDLIELIEKFSAAYGIRNQKIKTITRPNNPNILIDFVEMVARIAKQKLKQAIFEINDVLPKIKLKTKQCLNQETFPARMKARKMHTQVAEIKRNSSKEIPMKSIGNSIGKKQIKDRNTRQQQFQREHRQYMQEKRKQFLMKFEESYYEDKINSLFIELMQLNQTNHNIICKYRSKCHGQKSPKFKLNKCQVDLYSNEQRKAILTRLTNDFEQVTDLANMPHSQSKSLDLKNYRQVYLHRTVEYNNSQNNGMIKVVQKTVNSWLQLTTKLTFQLEVPIRINFMSTKGQKKSRENWVQELLNAPQYGQDKQSEPIRHSLGNTAASGSSRFRRQIVGCFSRKRIKQLLECQRISPTKKLNPGKSVQKSNTTLILPYLPSSGNSHLSKNEINLNLSNRYKYEDQTEKSTPKLKHNLPKQENFPLRQLVAKKIQSEKQPSNQNQAIKRKKVHNPTGSTIKTNFSIIHL